MPKGVGYGRGVPVKDAGMPKGGKAKKAGYKGKAKGSKAKK